MHIQNIYWTGPFKIRNNPFFAWFMITPYFQNIYLLVGDIRRIPTWEIISSCVKDVMVKRWIDLKSKTAQGHVGSVMWLQFVNDPNFKIFQVPFFKPHNFPSALSPPQGVGVMGCNAGAKKITGRSDWPSWSGAVAHNVSHCPFQYLESPTHWIKFMRWTEISHCQHHLRWVMYDSHFAEIPWGDVLGCTYLVDLCDAFGPIIGTLAKGICRRYPFGKLPGPGEIQLNWNWFQASTIAIFLKKKSRKPLLFDDFWCWIYIPSSYL